jgi:hypothetical protein
MQKGSALIENNLSKHILWNSSSIQTKSKANFDITMTLMSKNKNAK